MMLIRKQSFSMLLLTFRPWWLTWPLVPISLRSDFSNGDGQTILSTGHVDCIRWINVDSGQFHMNMSSLIIGFVDAADTYSPCRQWLTGEIWGSSETPKSGLDFVCICWIACQRQICWICSQEGIWILPILLQFFGVNKGLQVLGAPFCRQDPPYMLFLPNYVQCLNDWLAYLKLTKNTYYIFFSHNVVISVTRGNSQYVGVNKITLKFQSQRKPYELDKCKCAHHTHTHKLKRKIQIRYIIVKSKLLSFE